MASDATIGMLGPLEVRVGFGEPVEVVGPRLRTPVIGLAIDPDRVVLASQLMDAVWGGTAGGATNERAWPTNTWAKVGVDPQATARAVIGGWERGDLPGLQLGRLTAEEALALERSAMTYVREQLRERLARQLRRAWRQWLHPTSGRRSGVRFL